MKRKIKARVSVGSFEQSKDGKRFRLIDEVSGEIFYFSKEKGEEILEKLKKDGGDHGKEQRS